MPFFSGVMLGPYIKSRGTRGITWSHFSPFQINMQLWFFFHKIAQPAAILDDRKSFSNAFLAISDQYATFVFDFFFKMDAGGHFGSPIWAILDDRKSLSIAFLAISDQYTTFFFWIFFSQNGCRRPFCMTENHFWSHFSSFQINTQLWFFFTKSLPASILDDRKSLLITFLVISDQYATFIFLNFFSQNGCRRPFWMTENHFRMHFLPFQINAQLFFFEFFFQNGHRPPFWKSLLDDRKSLSIAFLAISDQGCTQGNTSPI